MLVAKCTKNRSKNPSYTLDKEYEINDIGMATNFFTDPAIDSWDGQFSNTIKPALNPNTIFKKNGCEFIILKKE